MWRRIGDRVPSWLSLLIALVPLAPLSDEARLVALWTFDEPAGERTAIDAGPGGLDGDIGEDIETDVVHDHAVAYRFADVAPNSPPVRPEHLVTVADDPSLNPDDVEFTVTVRLRTTSSAGNIVQKGQRESAGGYWKIEHDNGRLRCSFVGVGGRGVSALAMGQVADGDWHSATCRRTADAVTLWVDGVQEARTAGTTGSIANDWPLTVGGKPDCDQAQVGCDYFSGDVDFVKVEKV